MVSWRIIWVQLGCVAGAVICFYVLPGPNMLTLLCGIGAVLMQVLQRRHLERQQALPCIRLRLPNGTVSSMSAWLSSWRAASPRHRRNS